MFEPWTRPSQNLPGSREGWRTAVAFDEIAAQLAVEPLRLSDSVLTPDRRFSQFLAGLELSRTLINMRANKGYTERVAIVSMILFVKFLNDLLSATLLMRAGFSLQSFPCLRAALETAEVLEYLQVHPEDIDEYVRGADRFARDLSWLRAGLPAVEARRKGYDYFNYFTHANFKGLNIYTTFDHSPGVMAAHAGGFTLPDLEIVPFTFASALLAYGTRTLWKSDAAVVDGTWVERFEAFDAELERIFADLPDAELREAS